MPHFRFLTPDFPPEHRFYSRRLLIPATAEFLGLVNGALSELCQAHNWEKDGEMTEDEAAEFFLSMFQAYLKNQNEPPDWENPDELDGLPEQPWYDELADWIIAGFLAITFTPQAAVTYTATVPKLRIAFRTGNLGALFRVLINGVEVWTGDSYAPVTDLIEQVFDMSAETEPYTVRIEHNGVGDNINGTEAKLEVIRGKAVADMVATILRADPTGCGVQWSTDNGDTWDTVDLATCITGLANDAIIQAVNSGYLQRAGGQPGPSAPPEPETCKTYHVVLQANGQWLLPSGLLFGDTLIVENVSGGWTDGAGLWFCPDGGDYILGQCGAPGSHEEGDVLNPGAYHMALVMQAGETWYAAPLTLFTQESGTTALPVVFQANDGSLSDNAGSIAFDVTVCTAAASEYFCNLTDFTVSDGDYYAVVVDGHARATWSSSGWGFGYAGYNHIEHNFQNEFRDFEITTVEVWRDFQCDSGRDRLWAYNNDNQQTALLYDGNYAGWAREVVDGLYKTTWTGLSYIGILKLDVFGDIASAVGNVVKVVVRGPGQGPNQNNCT